ncbi:hypothetical protein V8C86DRAFT_3131813 [Haematococcus lacustris]
MYTSEMTADDESTTTFNFNLALVDSSMSQDFDGVDSDLNAEVNCSAMGIRDLKLAIFSSMEVVEVSVNNAVLDWQLTPNTPYSQWLWLLGVDYAMTDLQPYQPVPLKVVVRGGGSDVTELCPASSVFGGLSQGVGNMRTPYRIMYTSEMTADDESTTTFNFNLALVDSSMSQDFDGVDSDLNAEVNCSAMGIRDLKLAIFSSMEVVEVSVNNAVLDWQLTPNTPYSQWLWLLGVDYAMTDLQPYQPVPLKVVVRGGGSDVTELCPASSVFGGLSQGVGNMRTAPGGCGCRDDLSETPYRIMYTSEMTADDESTTTFNFNLALVDSSMSQDFDGVDSDLNAEVNCSAMGIRDLKLAIFSSMEVVEVSVNNAVLDWQLTPNTPYSQWLWLLGVDYAMTDLQPYQPVPLKVVVRGGGSDVTELCPASSVFGGLSQGVGNMRTAPGGCGCRDDLSETPYRIMYTSEMTADDESTTTFNFNLALVDSSMSQDFDGVDSDLNAEVNCSAMGIRDLKLAIFSSMEVVEVSVNNAVLDWQLTPNTPYSQWLWLLGVDYAMTDLQPYQPVPLKVVVRGGGSDVTELCPASSVFGSASSCEYIVTGTSGPGHAECCPKGVSSYYTPQRLRLLETNA